MAKATVCRLCRRSITPSGRGGRPVYCRRCTAKADRENARKPRVACKECGKAFPTKTRSVRYCSDGCRTASARRANIESRRRYEADPKKRAIKLARERARAAARRARERGERPPPRARRDVKGLRRNAKAAEPYACGLCGRDFAPYGGARPVHCKRCSAKIDRELGRKLTAKCRECGKAFTAPTRIAKYCSKVCRDDGRRRANREGDRRRMDDPDARALAAARTRASVTAYRARKKRLGRRRRA